MPCSLLAIWAGIGGAGPPLTSIIVITIIVSQSHTRRAGAVGHHSGEGAGFRATIRTVCNAERVTSFARGSIRRNLVGIGLRGRAGGPLEFRTRDEIAAEFPVGVMHAEARRLESARECIELAVMLGDDADSTGAVTGALAGAAYGASTLPTSWIEHVQFRERLESEAARLLVLSNGDQLVGGQRGGAASLR